ncbi:hypothetical protein PENTCL1PPCAC_22789, partial [Pristionchus entomophagus]
RMDDFLDDLLKDSDDEDSPTTIQVPQPKPLNMKNRLCSPAKKTSQPNCLGVVQNIKETSKNVSEFLGIRFKWGAVDISALDMLCKDMDRVSVVGRSHPSDSPWVSAGVIIEKSGALKSSNGNEYMIWKLHDLKNCEDKPKKMLLFGEAVKEHWKLQKGSVVVVMSPQVISDDKTSELALKVSKSSTIINIGNSVDLGLCKGKKRDGSECRAFVNQSKCEMCVYHAAGEVRKLAARRGTFSQSILIPKKNDLVKNNPHLLHQIKPKIIISQSSNSKSIEEVMKSEKDILTSMVNDKTIFSFGARCLASLSNGKGCVVEKKSGDESASFKEFLNSNEVRIARKANERTVKEEDAVKRALRILEENKIKNGGERRIEKRPRVEYKKDEGKDKGNGRNRVLELLAKRSRHSNEADEMENQMAMDHLSSLEKREAVETVATSCFQLKEVKVFSCSICKYTARNRSEYCIKSGHSTKSHLASKRFFSCKDCSYKCSTYSLLPTRRCQAMQIDNWERVSMVQERKVVLDGEKLEGQRRGKDIHQL